MSDIVCTSIGRVYMEANGKVYGCAAIQYSMGIDKLPNMFVTMATGIYIGNPNEKQESPEDLLGIVLSRKDGIYLNSVKCKVYEEYIEDNKIKSKLIFSGVIITGSYMYKAGIPTTSLIRFLCSHKATALYTKPLSEYTNVCMTSLSNYITKAASFDPKMIFEKAELLKAGATSTNTILQDAAAQIKNATLDKRVACIIDAIIIAGATYPNEQEPDGSLSGILDHLYSEYKPSPALSGNTDHKFNTDLCTSLIKGLLSGSIYEAIQQALNNTSFMLTLVPRWNLGSKDKEFKLEICPSTAWEGKAAATLNDANILDIDTTYSPISSLNTPDAFIVNFSEALDLYYGETTVPKVGANGVFSTISEVQGYLVKRYKNGAMDADLKDAMLRARLYKAPTWLHTALINTIESKASVTQNKAVRTPKQIKNKKKEIDLEKMSNVADDIAKALFVHVYGTADTSTLVLDPGCRFGYDKRIGYLEDMLGKIIDVNVKSNDGLISIRGELASISYNYSVGTQGTARYSIQLRRIRPLDKDEKTIKCPLYTK